MFGRNEKTDSHFRHLHHNFGRNSRYTVSVLNNSLHDYALSDLRIFETSRKKPPYCNKDYSTGGAWRTVVRLDLRPVSYAAGILIAMNLFPKPINYAAISVLTLADGLASLVGTRFGHHHLPYNKKKTIEGSTFFFIVSLLSTLIFVNPAAALLGSIVGTTTESILADYTENLMIPITVGFSMSILLLLSC